MAKKIKNGRTAEQCRSHHQKIFKQSKSKNFQGFIKYLNEREKKKKIKIEEKKENNVKEYI